MTKKHSIFIEWGDTDAAGIVFFPNFYKWMDESTHALFREMGLSTAYLMKEKNIGLPILEAHCEFISALYFEDSVVVETQLEVLKPKVIKLNHRFTCEGKIVAEGYTVRCWTSFGDVPKAIRMPQQIEDLLIQNGLLAAK